MNVLRIKEGEVYAYAYFCYSVREAVHDGDRVNNGGFRRVFSIYKGMVFYSEGGDVNYDCSISSFNTWIFKYKAEEVRNT